MVCDGNRCSMMATSPKWRSGSTRASSAPPRLRATARLVDRNVLPQPPLELNTVTTRPGDLPSPSVGAPPLRRPRRVLAISIALAAAVRTASSSLAEDRTSLTPTRRAWRNSSSDSWRRISSTDTSGVRSEEHTSELQSLTNLVCRLLLEKKKKKKKQVHLSLQKTSNQY